jgi:GGDEF domain-containing protein
MGYATNHADERMEDMLKRADMAMYQDKRNYYLNHNRRKPTANDI